MTDEFQLVRLLMVITDWCNYNCIHCCTNSSTKASVYLEDRLALHVASDFIKKGGRELVLSGGEPLRRQDLVFRILDEYATQLDRAILFTNGCLLTDRIAEQLAKFHDKIEIYISIFAADKELNDRITRIQGSLDATLQATAICQRYELPVVWHFPVLLSNWRELVAITELSEKSGVNTVGILRLVPQGRAEMAQLLTLPELAQFLGECYKLRRSRTGVTLKIGCHSSFLFLYDTAELIIPCTAGIRELVIAPDGTVVPCPAFPGLPAFIAGNIHTNSLSVIWESAPVLNRLRALSKESICGVCKTCPFLTGCMGRCVAQRLYHGLELHEGPDPLCPLPLVQPEVWRSLSGG